MTDHSETKPIIRFEVYLTNLLKHAREDDCITDSMLGNVDQIRFSSKLVWETFYRWFCQALERHGMTITNKNIESKLKICVTSSQFPRGIDLIVLSKRIEAQMQTIAQYQPSLQPPQVQQEHQEPKDLSNNVVVATINPSPAQNSKSVNTEAHDHPKIVFDFPPGWLENIKQEYDNGFTDDLETTLRRSPAPALPTYFLIPDVLLF